jgi:hypothetical protein
LQPTPKTHSEECETILAQLKEYDAKYGTITKEMGVSKSAYDECQAKVAKMETELIAVQNVVKQHTEEAAKNLEGLPAMKELMKSITDNRTEMEKTAADCSNACEATLKKLNETKMNVDNKLTTVSREYKTVENFCKRILSREDQKDKLVERLAKVEAYTEGLANMCKAQAEGVLTNTIEMATDNAKSIVELQNEMAVANQLIEEQRNRVGPTQKADENWIVQLIKKHTRFNSHTLQEIAKQHFGNNPITDKDGDIMTDQRVIHLIKDNFQEGWVREVVKSMLPKREELKEICREGYEDYNKQVEQDIDKKYQELLDRAQAAQVGMDEQESKVKSAIAQAQSEAKTANDGMQASILDQVLKEMDLMSVQHQDLLTTMVTNAVDDAMAKTQPKINIDSIVADAVTTVMANIAAQSEVANQASNQAAEHATDQRSNDAAPGGEPQAEGEDAPKHSGYVHFETRERAIAYRLEMHRQLMELDFLWKKDFESKNEAVAWMEESDAEAQSKQKTPDNQSKTPSSNNHPFKTPWSQRSSPKYSPPPGNSPPYDDAASNERDYNRRTQYDWEDYGGDHSPDGYYGNGTAFWTDSRGFRHALPNHPPNMDRAGQYVPNQEECERMNEQFEQEEYFARQGRSPPALPPEQRRYENHPGRREEYRNPHVASHRYENHPGRREEYRNPHVAPHYQERVYDDQEMKANYLNGRYGTPALQPSDIQRLGFTNPQKSHHVLFLMHQQLLSTWESSSRYENRSGPNPTTILSSSAFVPLESRKQTDVINWLNNLSTIALAHNIAITPFEHIEPTYGAIALCIPGVGEHKYSIMSRVLYSILSSKLLPMQVNADGSELSEALEMATDKEVPDGYELLWVLIQKLIPAFDEEELDTPWPKYSDYDTIFQYALAIEQTVMMKAKRQDHVAPKVVASQFLQGIMNEANQAYRFQAQILKTALTPLNSKGPIPKRFNLRAMATEITKSKPKEQDDPDLSKHHSIYKTNMSSTGTITESQPTSNWFQQATPSQDEDHMQGFTREKYCVNEAIYRPKDGRPRKSRYPVPDPAKSIKRKPSLYDASIQCEACKQRGHPAVRCFALAAALFINEFIAKRSNDATGHAAMENWMQRNAPILRDTQTNAALTKNPLQVLRAYMNSTGMSMEKIMDEVDWHHFDEGSTTTEVFGIAGNCAMGEESDE